MPQCNAPFPREVYQAYLKSPLWSNLREYRLEIDDRECRTCASRNRLEVHHIRYPAVLGNEDPKRDLITLCRDCHIAIHDSIIRRSNDNSPA